jgi:NNP family nitrate/nitrite transporter-like MFS transporter
MMLGPYLRQQFDVAPALFILLVAIPVLVTALVRLPAGILTDRYGARVMFPAASLCTAVAMFGLAFADSLGGVVVAGCAAGVGGAAFVVATSIVSRTFSYERRGLAIGVLGAGSVGAIMVAAALRWQIPEGRHAAEVLGAVLVGHAALAALVLRDKITIHRVGPTIRVCAQVVRTASTTSLTLLYALALGGTVAMAVYLPLYLTVFYGLHWEQAIVVMGVVLAFATTARLFGGWWTDRRGSVRLLTGCYAGSAGLYIVMALEPTRWSLTIPTIGMIAVLDGLAAGALLALICKSAKADSVGAVVGVAGAAAAIGGLLPPLIMIGMDHLSHSANASWLVLAALPIAAAIYVRANGLAVGMGLAIRPEPDQRPAALTMIMIGGFNTDIGAAAIVVDLADLAAHDELVVVYQTGEGAGRRLSPRAMVSGIRHRLPRHTVVAINIDPDTRPVKLDAAMVGELLEVGTIIIAVTSTANQRDVTAELAHYLRADRVVGLSHGLARGPEQHELWTRPTPEDHRS